MIAVTPLSERLLSLDTLTLHHGPHDDFGDGHCALELVAWLAGEEHSDRPACVCPAIAAFVRTLNDVLPSDEKRNEYLRPFLPSLVGSRSDDQDRLRRLDVEVRRAALAARWAMERFVPPYGAAIRDDAANSLHSATSANCHAVHAAGMAASAHAGLFGHQIQHCFLCGSDRAEQACAAAAEAAGESPNPPTPQDCAQLLTAMLAVNVDNTPATVHHRVRDLHFSHMEHSGDEERATAALIHVGCLDILVRERGYNRDPDEEYSGECAASGIIVECLLPAGITTAESLLPLLPLTARPD